MSVIDRITCRPFSLSVVPDRNQVEVLPVGDLDLVSAQSLDGEVRELWRRGFDCVVIDLRRVEFLDSTGLRVLLSLRNEAERAGHGFVLVPGPGPVQRLFDLTGTHGLFDWRDG